MPPDAAVERIAPKLGNPEAVYVRRSGAALLVPLRIDCARAAAEVVELEGRGSAEDGPALL